MRPKYTYQVACGAERLTTPSGSLKMARALAARLTRPGMWVEIERVLYLPAGARRYWLQTGKRWKLWDPSVEAGVRKPAWGRYSP